MMLFSRKRERGSLMVEAIAVIALLGLMGTILYRQVKQRNDELDNINMASEIRVVKEATMAYIQSNKSMLEANSGIDPGGCVDGGENACYGYYDNAAILNGVDGYMPDNWGGDGSIINSYRIGVICYVVVPGENRTACYGMIVPNSPNDPNGSPMPAGFTLRRAARVANLIGADGGVHPGGGDTTLNGTQGTWYLDECPGDLCDGRDDPFYVATTGVDVYIPEVDAPDNMALIPDSLALTRLHSTDYFSVGSGDQNCVTNYDSAGGHYQHENVEGGMVVEDTIGNVGDSCDPLFWVGTVGGASDSSEPGQVYVKNSLFVGRDNASGTHAVGIVGDTEDLKRKLTVYSADGNEQVTLNGAGQIIGRQVIGKGASNKGYKLDADTGSVVLYEVKNIPGIGDVEVPTLRLRGTRLESNKIGKYQASPEAEPTSEVYNVNPEGTSFMGDIRLASRGGAKLSEILPKYSLMNVKSIVSGGPGYTHSPVEKPSCPAGYVRAITVTPTVFNQRVTEVQLNASIPGTTAGSAVPKREPHFVFQRNDDAAGAGASAQWSDEQTSGDVKARLVMLQPGYVIITVDDLDANNWKVNMTYQGDTGNTIRDSSTKKYIHALAHTYCVYDASNFDGSAGTIAEKDEDASGFYASEGTKAKTTIPSASGGTVSCSTDADCLNTEYCTGSPKVCTLKGACTSNSGNWKCVDGVYVYAECWPSQACPDGKYCHNNRCKDNTSAPSPSPSP